MFWTPEQCRSVLSALVVANSGTCNQRRLEVPTYALWHAALCPMYDKHKGDGLLVAPQFALYRSNVADGGDPDASNRTVPDPHARGVLVDFCIILPRITTRLKVTSETFQTIMNRLDFTNITKIHAVLRILDLGIPILLEIKRPPPRHPSDIKHWGKQLVDSINKAGTQAREQAFCLFSSVRYLEQDEVMLIAACGHWWRWRLIRRDDPDITERVFDPEVYEIEFADYDAEVDNFDADELVQDREEEEFVPGLEGIEFFPPGEPKIADYRAERLRLRNERKSTAEFKDFMKESQAVVNQAARFTDKELEEAGVKLQDAEVRHFQQWTNLLRLGTETSGKHLNYIYEIIDGIVARKDVDLTHG